MENCVCQDTENAPLARDTDECKAQWNGMVRQCHQWQSSTAFSTTPQAAFHSNAENIYYLRQLFILILLSVFGMSSTWCSSAVSSVQVSHLFVVWNYVMHWWRALFNFCRFAPPYRSPRFERQHEVIRYCSATHGGDAFPLRLSLFGGDRTKAASSAVDRFSFSFLFDAATK